MKIEELPIWSYLLDADRQIYIERRTLPGERESWAVKDGNYCLNKDGEWEYEPMPSSRDEGFLKRCRFESAEEALSFCEQMVEER